MSRPYLSIGKLRRQLSNGGIEELQFVPGVNLLVGPPNTGKTKWLETIDHLLGDKDENPFEGAKDEWLAQKYDAASAELIIGDDCFCIERRWHEPGVKTKVFVDGNGMNILDFQEFLLQKLGIPLLNFPRGNPMSGQTWPELTFRTLLRHIYRRQLLWGDLAEKQPEGDQHACLLQFLGLAEHLFTEEYGKLVKLKMKVERLKARRDQYGQTLDELARDILSAPGMNVGVNITTVRNTEDRLASEMETLRLRRTKLISDARDQMVSPEKRGHTIQLGEERALLVVKLEELKRKAKATADRLDEMGCYQTELGDELDRIARTEDAGAILADLKITHCPACDQLVKSTVDNPKCCFLCHQVLPDEPQIEGLGVVRLQFEHNRLLGEFKESEDLLDVLQNDAKRLAKDIIVTEERLRMLENELAPARQAVAGLVQEEISAIDMALGELNERQRQLSRISAALDLGNELTKRIADIEREIEPLQAKVDEAVRATDFYAAAAQLKDGINAYFDELRVQRPAVWPHSPVTVDISRYNFTIRVGGRLWQKALGGTDTLYFLMAYHYGLLTLSDKPQCHFPGLTIIDIPAEFSGEAVGDKENFIVQPFIELLSKKKYEGAQLIITGASFEDLEKVHRLQLSNVYVF